MRYNNKNKIKFDIITSVIPGADHDYDCASTLNTIAKFFKCDVTVIPTAKNYRRDVLDLSGLSVKTISRDDYELNSHLHIKKTPINVNKEQYIKANPTGKHSMLYPAPSFQAQSIARQLKSEPTEKMIWCTGTISEPYYKETVGGNEALDLHQKGALLLETHPDGMFRIHQLEYSEKHKNICFLKWKFSNKGKVSLQKVKALIEGDIHPDEADLEVVAGTQSIINKLNVPKVFHHDWFNGSTISHHSENDIITKNRLFRKIGRLEDELKLVSDFFKDYEKKCPKTKHYYVHSNHPEHLKQYLRQHYRHDYVNYDTVVKLNTLNFEDESTFWFKVMNWYNKFNKSKHMFLSQHNIIKILSFVCSEHGMDGSNGARGSLRGLDKFLKLIIGHSHTPGIGRRGSIQVGTSTGFKLGYVSAAGTTTWANANAIVNENDTANLMVAIGKVFTFII